MKRLSLAVAALAAFATGCDDNRAATKRQTGPQATLVTVTKADVRTLEVTEESVGALENFIDPKVGAEVAGRVVSVQGFVGKKVKRGDPLAEIDASDLEIQARADSAEIARLEALVANQDRIIANQQKLVEKNYISQNALDESVAQGKAVREQLAAARAKLDANRNSQRKTKVVSPIDGEVEVQIVAPGDYVKLGDPLFQLVGTHLIHAHLPFPESAASRLKVGQLVRLSSPLVPDLVVEAKIDEIRPTITATSRALDVIVKFGTDGKFRGGGTVNAQVVTGRKPAAVVVPEQSVVLRPAGKVVYLVEDGKAVQRVVETGYRQDGLTEITAGLAGGETIAVDGAGFLTNNAIVAISRPRGEKSAPPSGPVPTAERPGAAKPIAPAPKAGRVVTLPELSIQRHVFAVMLNAVLVLFGLIAYQRIGMDKLPYVEFPVVSVQTTLKGANPDVVDSAITGVIEGSVNSVPGIEHIQSTSSPGVSQINITFNLDKRIDVAFNEVQAKVNQVLRRLPKDADPPVVAKVETNTSPIFWMAISGDRTQQQLNQYAINVIKKKLETIDGVGEVRVGGRRDRTIRVNLLPGRMAAFGIAAQDIQDAFAREHLQVAGGFIVGGATEHLVKLDLEFHNMDDLETMIVGFRDGSPIRLKDIAEIEDGLSDFRQLARFNGQTAVGLGAVKIPNTNTVAIVERILERLDHDIIPSLPPGMKIDVVQNDAVFIGESIRALKEHLFEGTLLASLVVLFFLRSLRSTLIIATAIPVSLLGAVAVIYFFGYTFNSVTMLALLLLIGVVVDDSIVVLENIFRHREHLDPDPISAAMNGSREVTFAVLAATLSLVSIFAPVIFIGGVIGQFFKSFAVVVTFGVLVSWFVSLTLTPMLCSRFLRVHKHEGRVHRWLDGFFGGMERVYRRFLEGAIRHRWKVLAATALISLSSVYFYSNIGKELAPAQDEGRFLITMRTPLGSSIQYTETRLRQVEEIVKQFPEVVTEWGIIGLGSAQQVNQATLVIRMLPKDERRAKSMRSQQQVLATIRREISQVPGARVFARGFGVFPGQRTEPLQFVVTGPNLQEMGRNANERPARAPEQPGDRPHGHRPPARPAAARARARPHAVAGVRAERERRRLGAQHADRRRRHREVQRRAGRRPALRHPRQGEGRRVPAAGRPLEDLPPQPAGTADPARQRREVPGAPRAGGDRSVRPRVRRDVLQHPGGVAGRCDRHRARRGREAAARLSRPVHRRGGGARQDHALRDVRVRRRLGSALHGAREPVQLVRAAADHHARRPARDRRRAVLAVAGGPGGPVGDLARRGDPAAHAEHLLDDRPRAADRPGGEELDPARRPDQPAARRRGSASTTRCATPARSGCGRC